jgi:hypothetical protein
MHTNKNFSLIGKEAEIAEALKAKGYSYCLISESGEIEPLYAKTAKGVASILLVGYPSRQFAISTL